jgi:uncharacterized repeat protein (TIGR03806 family)
MADVPDGQYETATAFGGSGVAGCTGADACTDQAWGVDLNGDTGFAWSVAGGTGGVAEVYVQVAVPGGGTRAMSFWVNGVSTAIIFADATGSPRPTGQEFGPYPAVLAAGTNTLELRDTEGTAEFDVHHLRIEGSTSPSSNSSSSFSASSTGGGVLPDIRYEASSALGGPGVSGCTGTLVNCTAQTWGIDLNGDTGFRWSGVQGGAGGNADLYFTVASPSGSRSMSIWINGVENAVLTTTITASPRPAGSTFGPFGVTLTAGSTNTIELRDTEGTAEFDVHHLVVANAPIDNSSSSLASSSPPTSSSTPLPSSSLQGSSSSLSVSSSSVIASSSIATSSSSSTGTPVSIKLEAEAFTRAFDTTPTGNTGLASCGRTSNTQGVDMQISGDSDGSCNVGWTTAGEWLEWDINVPADANYQFVLRAASNVSTGVVNLEIDGVSVTSDITVLATGGWQNYINLRALNGGIPQAVYLPAGPHTLRINWLGGGLNLNYLMLEAVASDPTLGLNGRPLNTTCVAGDAPSFGQYDLQRVWPGITFSQPVGLFQKPGNDANDYYITEKTGRVVRLSSNFASTVKSTFIDLTATVVTGGEGGVWSMAFHPNYPTTPYIYVSHMDNVSGTFVTRISRFTSADGITATGQKVIFEFNQALSPFGSGSIHNGGSILFGQDGYLYMSLGDDFYSALEADNVNNFYGKIIRIDVDTGNSSNYNIPPTNPFGNEVFAFGFRNPWRMTMDQFTGDIWVGDVGEECYEEINKIVAGTNYGWPNWENGHCTPTIPVKLPDGGNCNAPNTLPEHAYGWPNGVCQLNHAITGGYVYRGSALPALEGKYVYNDYISGIVSAYDPVNDRSEDIIANLVAAKDVAAWGEGNNGELFAVNILNGVYRLVASAQQPSNTGPAQNLEDTGCISVMSNPPEFVSGAVPFDVAQSFWSDGIVKERLFAIPSNSDFNIDSSGDWELPPGGVLIKNFRIPGQTKLFETRFFVRYNDGSYGAYTYQWDDDTTATLVPSEGADKQVNANLDWHYPARNDCFVCHTSRAGYSLSLETRQLNIDYNYPSTGRTANQLTTLVGVGMATGNTAALPAHPSLNNAAAPLASRAEAYLHVNCASCHRGAGGTQSQWDARIDTPFASKGICNVSPSAPVTGAPDEAYIKPGDHAASAIWWRMHLRGDDQMPPLASVVADSVGADLLAEWIDALSPSDCPEVVETSCNVNGNLVSNCDFSAGLTDWEKRVGSVGNGNVFVTAGELQIDVLNASTLPWHLQTVQVLGELLPGTYNIRFDARASAARTIEVNIGEQGEDYTSLCQQFINLTTSMQSFTINCGNITDNVGINNVKIDFNAGGNGNASVVIDNVYFGL